MALWMMMVLVSKACAFHSRFYYPMPCRADDIDKRPRKMMMNSEPYVVYRYNDTLHVLSDKCPHQGASLSKGWVNYKGNIHCPYHAFEFDTQGRFCGIPDPSKARVGVVPTRKPYVSSLNVFEFEKDVFVCPSPNQVSCGLPYYPPEHFNDEFVYTDGSRVIHQDYRVVTENVLDMLHISYIHSFGNRQFPLPSCVKFHELNDLHGRSTFRYRPNEMSISNKIGRSPVVIVENEYHLPTTTITRVIAGNVVKTILTRSTPISENKTHFFYRVYRNFWRSKELPFLNVVGDVVVKMLMQRTVEEDVGILRHVYADSREGTLTTKYDITIKKYREALEKYVD